MIEGYQRPAGYSEAGRRIEEAGRAYEAKAREAAKPPARRDWLLIYSEDPSIRKRPTVKSILADASALFKIPREVISGRSRVTIATLARHYVMQRAHDETGLSSCEIGRRLGNFNHSSVLLALKPRYREKVHAWLEKNSFAFCMSRSSFVSTAEQVEDSR